MAIPYPLVRRVASYSAGQLAHPAAAVDEHPPVGFVHAAPPVLVGHAAEAHSMAPHVTSQAHASMQVTIPHAFIPVHVTLHAASAPQSTSLHAPAVLQARVHGTSSAHRRSPHALFPEQVIEHELADAGQLMSRHALLPEHVIVHA
jgi:hypothetical protein